jgi:hypothetical protein
MSIRGHQWLKTSDMISSQACMIRIDISAPLSCHREPEERGRGDPARWIRLRGLAVQAAPITGWDSLASPASDPSRFAAAITVVF